MVKINVDVATLKNSRKVVAAAIARDTASNVLGGSSLVIHGLLDVEIVEVLACKESLALACDIIVQHFSLASDNVNVIREIKKDAVAAHGHIIREIQARAAYFRTADFVALQRGCSLYCKECNLF